MEKFWGTVPYVDHALSVNEETFLPQTKRETLFDNMLVLRQQRQGDTFMEFENRDKRFYATVTYDGAYMGPKSNPVYEIQTWIDKTTMDDQKTLQYSALHSGYRNMENIESAPTGRAS